MAYVLLRLWLLILVRMSLALDPVGSEGRWLVNNVTKGLLTMNGIWYALSNSTTDVAKMDSLTNAEACARDAALMSRLGFNTIYVDAIDESANHDDCFSIFNSVGIYVAVVLEGGALGVDKNGIDSTYTTERLEKMFKRIDAIKDYENLLAIDIGMFPDKYRIDINRFADLQKMFRAIIRDTKEYVQRHSSRPILVGGTLTRFERDGNMTNTGVFDHLSCVVPNENPPSAAEFVSFWDFNYYEYQSRDLYEKSMGQLSAELENSTIPAWLSGYATGAQNGEPQFEVWNETLYETSVLYNVSNEIIAPYGPLAGGSRYEWANVRLSQATDANWGITIVDANGNIRLTENYDTLNDIFSDHNTESWLSGQSVGYDARNEPPECKPELIVNVTTSLGSTRTLSLATDWDLPTRPAGLDAIITSGAQGTRGQMVDVVTTTIKYEIKGSNGEVLTDVALSPSKSSPRSTTARETSPGASGSVDATGMSPQTKTGIGVGIGVGVGGTLALVGVGFFLFRRIKNKKAAVVDSKGSEHGSEGTADVQKYEKMELATGPDVEAKPPAELPDRTMETPKEVPGDGYPGIDAAVERPVELPVHEPALELPGEQRNRDAQ